MKLYSREIAQAINDYLESNDWDFSFDEKTGVFKFILYLRKKIKAIEYRVQIRESDYLVYSNFPIVADEPNIRGAIAEFVCRANYDMVVGNFEVDMRDGSLRYKVYVDYEGINIPSVEMIKTSIHCPGSMFERYGDGIIKVILGISSAEEAVSKCEKMLNDLIDLISELESRSSEEGKYEDSIVRLAEMLEEARCDGSDDFEE